MLKILNLVGIAVFFWISFLSGTTLVSIPVNPSHLSAQEIPNTEEPLGRMSLEEKVGQLFIVHFQGKNVNAAAATLIKETKVGGFIYYNWANGLDDRDQVRDLSSGLQQLAQQNQTPIPLLIAVDQEGGVVSRLSNGFTVFPGNRALGETNQPGLAKDAAVAIGKELMAVGVNVNFAPVVDVNINPRNPIIGVRSFSDQPETVVNFGKQALEGYREAHIIASLKHFPGHGDVEIDSHEDLPIISKSQIALEEVELFPFKELASSADMIMTAHLLVPALDPDNCSTLSASTLEYLKTTIGFKGVIVTDSLVMEGVLKKCKTVDEAAIQALNAGCDLLCFGGKALIGKHSLELSVEDIQRIHKNIVAAVREEQVSEERLNDAVRKILGLKKRYLNAEASESQLHLPASLNLKDHQELANTIASLALKEIPLRLSSSFISLNEKNVVIFAPELLKNSIQKTSLPRIGKKTDSCFFSLSPSDEEIEMAKQQAQKAQLLLVFSYNAWKTPSQKELIDALLETGKPVVVLVVRDSLDTELFPKATAIFETFSPTWPSIEAASQKLKEKGMLHRRRRDDIIPLDASSENRQRLE